MILDKLMSEKFNRKQGYIPIDQGLAEWSFHIPIRAKIGSISNPF
jgi:hypothetical protein